MLYNKDTNMDKNALIIFCHADKRQKIHNYLCRCMAAERSFFMQKRRKRFLRIIAVICAVCMLAMALVSVLMGLQGLF